MGADGHDRGAHIGRILVQELVGRDDAARELAGFRENGLDIAPLCHEILDLVGIKGKEFTAPAREERVFDRGEEERTERRRLLPQSTFMEIEYDPPARIHRFEEGERRMRLPYNVTEVRIG